MSQGAGLRRQHPFWGSLSPLGGLSGIGLLIMASSRLAWAITVAGSLFWVYTFSALAFAFLSSKTCNKFFPAAGKKLIFACLASFFGGIHLLIFWLLCPFAVFEVFLPLLLVPLFCANSGIFEKIISQPEASHPDIGSHVSDAVSQAAVLAGLLIAFSVIREPLSYCSLSFPGTYRGMIMIVSFKAGSFFPVGIIAGSAGALLLLGYFSGLYQYCRSVFSPGDADK